MFLRNKDVYTVYIDDKNYHTNSIPGWLKTGILNTIKESKRKRDSNKRRNNNGHRHKAK